MPYRGVHVPVLSKIVRRQFLTTFSVLAMILAMSLLLSPSATREMIRCSLRLIGLTRSANASMS